MYTYSTTQNNKWDFSQLYLKPKQPPPSIHSSFGGKFICSMCFSSTLFYYSNSIVVVVGKKPKVSLSLSLTAMIFLYSHSLGSDFGFRATQTISLAPHIYRKCFCCSHKKAHDINFPSNSRHRRLRYVKGRERERKSRRTKTASKAKSIFTNDKHMKYFCMMEWKRENERERVVVVVKNCWGIFVWG